MYQKSGIMRLLDGACALSLPVLERYAHISFAGEMQRPRKMLTEKTVFILARQIGRHEGCVKKWLMLLTLLFALNVPLRSTTYQASLGKHASIFVGKPWSVAWRSS